MHINHESPAFTTNGCKWVQDQPELYQKSVGPGRTERFIAFLVKKVLQNTVFAAIPMQYACVSTCNFFYIFVNMIDVV